MAEIADDHIEYLDTFYAQPVPIAEIGDDAESWRLIDDLVDAGYLHEIADDDEQVSITQAGKDLLDADDEDEEEESEPAVYRSYFHGGAEADVEAWADLDGALWACRNYIQNGAKPGDAVVQLIETGDEIDIYDFLEANAEG